MLLLTFNAIAFYWIFNSLLAALLFLLLILIEAFYFKNYRQLRRSIRKSLVILDRRLEALENVIYAKYTKIISQIKAGYEFFKKLIK
jgi:hypothetical protein